MRRKVALVLATALVAVAATEVALHALAFAFPPVDDVLRASLTALPHTVPDAKLGHRPNPEVAGHDARGFRNPRARSRAEIVALGDSQTYGTGVRASEAWPRRLEALTQRTVYSMAYGRYGPAHGLVLWDEAEALGPSVVIQAVYAGNDLFDCFDLVYGLGTLPELASPEAAVRRAIQDAEAQDPIHERASRAFEMQVGVIGAPKRSPSPARVFLARHSRLHGLARGIESLVRDLRDRLREDPEREWEEARRFAARHPGYAMPFDDGIRRTVFTPAYRSIALDQSDPRIAEGRRIAFAAIHRMQVRARERDIRFLVLLIPTKELVFRDHVAVAPAEYTDLVRREIHFWASATAFLEEEGIQYLDLLPALRRQLAEGEQPYRVDTDGHPNRVGHEVVAEAVASALSGGRGSATSATN